MKLMEERTLQGRYCNSCAMQEQRTCDDWGGGGKEEKFL